MSFGWCHDERPYPDEEMEDLKAKIARLIKAGDDLDEAGGGVASHADEVGDELLEPWWAAQDAWQEAKNE